MDFVCLQEYLKEGLRITERISAKHSTLPVLQNILIKTGDTGVLFQATNLEIGVSTIIPSKIKTAGSIVIPAKLLLETIQALPNEPIRLFTTKQNPFVLQLECGKVLARVNGMTDVEFPTLPKTNKENAIELSKKQFFEAIIPLIPVVSPSEARPELSGILMSFSENECTVAGTDTFRLGEYRFPVVQTAGNISIIPLQTVQEIIRIFSAAKEETITVYTEKNYIAVEAGKTNLISRLIEGNYPNYAHIIPSETKAEFVIDRIRTLQQVKSASIFASRLNDIHIAYEPGNKTIRIKSEDAAKGAFETTIEAEEAKGESGTAVFNARYLTDGLEGFAEEKINFSFSGDGKPGVLRSIQTTSGKQLYMLMPINL